MNKILTNGIIQQFKIHYRGRVTPIKLQTQDERRAGLCVFGFFSNRKNGAGESRIKCRTLVPAGDLFIYSVDVQQEKRKPD